MPILTVDRLPPPFVLLTLDRHHPGSDRGGAPCVPRVLDFVAPLYLPSFQYPILNCEGVSLTELGDEMGELVASGLPPSCRALVDEEPGACQVRSDWVQCNANALGGVSSRLGCSFA